MARIDGGELLVRALRAGGVDTVFTLHGGHLDAFLQAAARDGIRLIDTRHEQAAGHAADGWARATGRTGVAVVTAGPGVTDTVSAVANAFLDAVPIVVIGGAAPLRDAETLPLQGGFDQVAMMAPVCKWSHRVTHTERIGDLVTQALRVARTGRPGPVFLEVPIDVLFARVDEAAAAVPAKVLPDAAPAPSGDVARLVVDRLAAAERPAILAGGGVLFSGAQEVLRAFAERTGVPVFTNAKSRGVVPTGHPLAGGAFGGLALAAMQAGPPDVLLVLGARFGLFTGGRAGGVIPADAFVVQVDIEPEEIGRNRDVDLGVVADCREALAAFDAAAKTTTWSPRPAWAGAVAAAANAHRAFEAPAAGDDGPIHPYRLCAELAAVLPDDAIICADGGETSGWMDMVARTSRAGNWMSHGYLGCLGTGMPFAIAAQAAFPSARVCCIVGDGSVGLNLSEFDTMARHDLPILTVVNNDRQWGMSAHGQELIYGKRVATDLGTARYDLAAAGLGCHAEFVEHARDLRPALERALASGRPACVNVHTDRSIISPVTLQLVGVAATPGGDSDRIVLPYYDDLEG